MEKTIQDYADDIGLQDYENCPQGHMFLVVDGKAIFHCLEGCPGEVDIHMGLARYSRIGKQASIKKFPSLLKS